MSDETKQQTELLDSFLDFYEVAALGDWFNKGRQWYRPIVCPWDSAHENTNQGTSTCIVYTENGGYGFDCKHKCSENDWKTFRAEMESRVPDKPRFAFLPEPKIIIGSKTNGHSAPPYLAHGPLAESFAEQSRDFVFLYDRGTYAAWVGSRWSVGDADGLLLKRAVNSYLGGLFSEYAEPQEGKADYRKQLFDSRFRQGVVDQVRPLLPSWKFSEEFDRDVFLLGVPGNQVIDLRTGTLREMQREDRVTKRTRVAPDANCRPVRFLRFIEEITLGDKDLAAYLMRYGGYVLSGSTKAQCVPFWYGHGANGKGTLINVLQNIMGMEYGTVLRMSNLSHKEKEDDSQRRIIAKLCGARLATANEGNAKVKLDMSLLKSLASSDLLTGAFLYEREFVFQPSHKLIIATNHKPDLEIDTAARRRVHLVPFDAEFTGSKEDNSLEDALKTEAPGIMALLVRACLDWQAGGLAAPKRVAEATAQLFNELDPIGRFAKECLTEATIGSFITTEDLVKAYVAFLQDNDIEADEVLNVRTLISRLKELPGVKQVQRVGADGVRRRGLIGRKLLETDSRLA